MRCLLIIMFSVVIYFFSFSQVTFYQNTLKGRVSVRAFGIYDSSSVSIPIQLNDTINKVFLISTNLIEPINTTSYFNGCEVFWDSTSQVTTSYSLDEPFNGFQLTERLNIIDVTKLINPTETDFTLYTPTENLVPPNTNYNVSRYHGFTLYLEYKNSFNSIISSSIILNDLNSTSVIDYEVSPLPKISNAYPVGLALSMGILTTSINDGSYIYVNNDSIGLVSGTECCRPSG